MFNSVGSFYNIILSRIIVPGYGHGHGYKINLQEDEALGEHRKSFLKIGESFFTLL